MKELFKLFGIGVAVFAGFAAGSIAGKEMEYQYNKYDESRREKDEKEKIVVIDPKEDKTININ